MNRLQDWFAEKGYKINGKTADTEDLKELWTLLSITSEDSMPQVWIQCSVQRCWIFQSQSDVNVDQKAQWWSVKPADTSSAIKGMRRTKRVGNSEVTATVGFFKKMMSSSNKAAVSTSPLSFVYGPNLLCYYCCRTMHLWYRPTKTASGNMRSPTTDQQPGKDEDVRMHVSHCELRYETHKERG